MLHFAWKFANRVMITLIFFIVLPFGLTEDDVKRESVCLSNDCKRFASRMLDMVDHTADPCQDFYQFSCGGVVDDAFLIPEKAELVLDSIIKDQMQKTQNNVLDFFEACRTSMTHPNALSYQANETENRKISTNYSKNPSLSSLLSDFMRNDFAPVFDVTVDVLKRNVLKFIPRIGISFWNIETSERTDMNVCLNQFESKIKADLRQGSHSVNISDQYDEYLSCMKSAGVDARIERIKEAVNDLDLFDYNLEYEDEEIILQNMKTFLIDIKEILSTVKDDDVEVVTVGNLKHELGNFIEWPSFLGSLVGIKKMNRNANVMIQNKQILRNVFAYLKKEWTPRDLENIMLMLWAERTYLKPPSNREAINDVCFQEAKRLLPDDVKVLFSASLTSSKKDKLRKEIGVLGERISSELLNIIQETKQVTVDTTNIHRLNIAVEGNLDYDHLRENINLRMIETPITPDHLNNVYQLQRKRRKEMYTLIGQELTSVNDCRFLPRHTFDDCCHKFHEIVVPVHYLVKPNLYFEKKIPNYLKFAGVSEFVARKILNYINVNALEIGNLESWNCLKEQTRVKQRAVVINQSNVEASILFHSNAEEELRLSLQTSYIAWRTLRIFEDSSALFNLGGASEEPPLIWLQSAPLSPIKAFLIKNAQSHCDSKSDFNLLKIVEENQLPAKFKVNTMAKKDPLFASAFQCPSHSPMSFQHGCPIPETATTVIPSTSFSSDEEYQ